LFPNLPWISGVWASVWCCSCCRRNSFTIPPISIRWAATNYSDVGRRIEVWKDPFHDPLGAGYQAVQSLFSFANGGLFGTGYGQGRPDYIPEVATDYVYAAFGEEWGAIGSIR